MSLPTRAEWKQNIRPVSPAVPIITARQIRNAVVFSCMAGAAFCVLACYVIDRWQLNFSL